MHLNLSTRGRGFPLIKVSGTPAVSALELANHPQNDAYATLTLIDKMSAKKVSIESSRPMIHKIEITPAAKLPGKCGVRGGYRANLLSCHLRVEIRLTKLGFDKRVQNVPLYAASALE